MASERAVILVGDLQQANPQRGFLEALETQYPEHQYWFLGDCLDSWTSKPVEQVQSLKRILELIEAGRARCVWSNHDAGYAFPNLNAWCSGWNSSTAAMVCSGPLAPRMRKLIEPYIAVEADTGKLLVTHAGISARWLAAHSMPPNTFTTKDLDDAFRGDRYWEVGRARGGSAQCGGPLWCDWDMEFDSFDPWFQVVGHTHQCDGYIKQEGDSGGGAINIDTLGHKGKGEQETLLCIPDLTYPTTFTTVGVTL